MTRNNKPLDIIGKDEIVSGRKKVPDSTLTEVLVASSRRCCLCFGLDHDDKVKKGQVAHLDGIPANNDPDNLAFLCLLHHDEFDGRTSQSKGITASEIKVYREKLYAHLGSWSSSKWHEHFLNFLASTVGLEEMADAAIKVGESVAFHGEEDAFRALTTPEINSCDAMIYVPYLQILDTFQSWGWLTYDVTEKKNEYGELRVYMSIKHKPICQEVAGIMGKRNTNK